MRTALNHCSAGMNMNCVQFLVKELMVPVDPLDKWGSDQQDYAISAENTEMMEYLIEKKMKNRKMKRTKSFHLSF